MTELRDEINFIHVLPMNQENYRAIKIDSLWFIDSYQFMTGSLDSLVKQEVSVTKVKDLKIINQARGIKNRDGRICEKKRNFYLKKGLVPWQLVTEWSELIKNIYPLTRNITGLISTRNFHQKMTLQEPVIFTRHLNVITL